MSLLWGINLMCMGLSTFLCVSSRYLCNLISKNVFFSGWSLSKAFIIDVNDYNCSTKILGTFVGTPSLADPNTIAAVIDTVRGNATLPGDAEITLEVNPTKLETRKLR